MQSPEIASCVSDQFIFNKVLGARAGFSTNILEIATQKY
jgi:hypothetical protein